ncbi:translation initiation factor eIF-2B [Natranaeroarchaeum aerophilus]|uniref:Translation initiation factor eIF-2B n=1 Tax=Natranaeroarchaeum aerophilus TaxID=2917711 RepID=A0AAE3FPP8_9EURY|nr:translation initiation factor eIF-2B [Natranaeroarchaeum aerophilus]MCL9812881.1 translation initiation factor eIF-2B [Natranaeroarchaeum aerophilus]
MIDETVREITEMQTRSASHITVRAAEALLELLDREYRSTEEFQQDLERNSRVLKGANRSHAPLNTTQRRIITAVSDANLETVADAKTELERAVDEVITEVEESKEGAASRAASLIEDGDTILTHSNSSTATLALEYASDAGTEFTLYVTETRPNFFGRLTARQFADDENVDVRLIVDSAMGTALPDCDRVIVGMNCLIGDEVYNRVGTYPIAATAADLDVPMTIVGSSSKFIGDGFEFQQTYRSGSEVMLEPTEGFDIENPLYDRTPTRLLDQVVTEDGIIQF